MLFTLVRPISRHADVQLSFTMHHVQGPLREPLRALLTELRLKLDSMPLTHGATCGSSPWVRSPLAAAATIQTPAHRAPWM